MSRFKTDHRLRIMRAVSISEVGCWEWKLKRTKDGYGRMNVRQGAVLKTVRVHRYAWELWIGAIPEGMHILHRCDNPLCCNPAHLFLGEHADNMRDMYAKGRWQRRCPSVNGEEHA